MEIREGIKYITKTGQEAELFKSYDDYYYAKFKGSTLSENYKSSTFKKYFEIEHPDSIIYYPFKIGDKIYDIDNREFFILEIKNDGYICYNKIDNNGTRYYYYYDKDKILKKFKLFPTVNNYNYLLNLLNKYNII